MKEKELLKQQAQARQENLKQEKNVIQKIRLILNVITPDNFDKKFGELRTYLFADLMSREETDEKDMEYLEETHKLKDGDTNTEILNVIVENIFRKAQLEKEYCIFYGELCEKMIKLELSLRDEEIQIKNMKNS